MRFTFRSLFLAATSLLGACSTSQTGTERGPQYPWFPFKWYNTTIGGKPFEKVAILVPVKVSDVKGNFIAQFDLGSDATVLYEEALKNYFASRAQLYARVDTTRRGVNDNGVVIYGTKSLPLALGPGTIPHPLLMTKYGDPVAIDSLYTASDKLIGTIGSDFLKNKVLVIDYPQHRMCVLDSVDRYWRARTTFVSARVLNNRFHLPITVGARTYWAAFDTGASLFSLSTDYDTWRALVGSAVPVDTLSVNSWGEKVPFYGAFMQQDAYLGSAKLPKSKVWFNRNKRLLDFNKGEQVDALTGNAFFLTNIIVLDFKQNKFGVVN